LDDRGHSVDINRPRAERTGTSSGKARHFILSLRSKPPVSRSSG
jgi:hypothetical protein